ncbi:MAG: hypothetical protein ABNG98_10615 [Flavobacterium sp.]|jgi:hypothetical protein
MLELAIYLVVLIVLVFGLVKLIDKFVSPKGRTIVSVVLWIVSLFLGYLIYSSVMKPIEFDKAKADRYEMAVRKMLDIKKAQSGYKTVYGKYADSFEELIRFIENEKFSIISRKDTIVIDVARNKREGMVPDENGVGGYFIDYVKIDTLGTVSVKDSLFKNTDRYKNLKQIKIGDLVVPISLKTSSIIRNETKVSTFQCTIDKNLLLSDLDQDLVASENKVEGIDKINGDQIILGSLEEASVTGNWPKKYGSNE